MTIVTTHIGSIFNVQSINVTYVGGTSFLAIVYKEGFKNDGNTTAISVSSIKCIIDDEL